jgi:hypothetical protein
LRLVPLITCGQARPVDRVPPAVARLGLLPGHWFARLVVGVRLVSREAATWGRSVTEHVPRQERGKQQCRQCGARAEDQDGSQAAREGTLTVPITVAEAARTAPATTLEMEMLIDRTKVLTLLADAVPCTGTADMISGGMDPSAKPMPAPMTAVTTNNCHTDPIMITRMASSARAKVPIIRVMFGPNLRDTTAKTGAVAMMAAPLGTMVKTGDGIVPPRPYPVASGS